MTESRFKYLTKALKKCRLTDEQRWLVHQERASILRVLEYPEEVQSFRLPEDIEDKIKQQLR